MKNILILTGGSRGIGRAILEKYQKENFLIFSISRNIIEDFASDKSLEQIQYDLSDSNGIEDVLKQIFLKISAKEVKTILLINNAGSLGDIGRSENNNLDTTISTIQLNITAPLVLSSLFIKYTKDWNCQKTILNISSGAATKAYYGWTTYCTTKAALDMMTRSIGLEQKEAVNPVKVISVYPGVVDTKMQENIRKTSKDNFIDVQRFIDLKNNDALSKPDDVAQKIFLIANDLNIKNGSIIDVRNLN